MEPVMVTLFQLLLLTLLLGSSFLAAAWAQMRKWKPGAIVFTAACGAALFMGGLFFLVVFGMETGSDRWNQVRQVLQGVLDNQAALMVKAGTPPDRVAAFKDAYLQFFPAWMAFGCLVIGFISYYLSSNILSRLFSRVSKAVAFRDFIIPESLVFGFIAGCFLKLFMNQNPGLNFTANNLLAFFVSLYLFGGFSIVSFFFHKWRFPWFLRVAAYVLICFNDPWGFFVGIVVGLGLLDVWFDFRKIKSAVPTSGAGEQGARS